MIALACDHHGIALKHELMKMLDEMGLEWKDFGTFDVNSKDDYPVYGYKAAKAVASGECDRGILLCGTGMGISIAAGKVPGIRVCTCSDVYSAEMSKRHNNSNVLTMGALVVGTGISGRHRMNNEKNFGATFDTVAADYDQIRPGYVSDIYSTIFDYIPIGENSRVIEVGSGTGQATEPVLKTGCELTAVEYGVNLSEVLKAKFRDYQNFHVVTARFEDAELEEDAYDLVFSATAFHWVPEEIGYPKLYSILKKPLCLVCSTSAAIPAFLR